MKTIDDLDVAGKTVLLRADFNVPLAKDGSGTITDDGRIVAALPTINALREKGAKIIVAAHLGRPAGTGFEEAYSLDPVAKRMGELLGTEVKLACDVTGESAKELAANLAEGDVMLLENVRFDKREASKVEEDRQALAQELVGLGAQAYVSDGFGVVHRKQASVTDVAALLPNAAGSLVAKEVHAFDKVLNDPERPYVVVLGGAKVSDKLGVINNLLGKVDRLVIGGGMCFTFLKAKGYSIGKSLLEEEQVDQCREYIERAERDGVELILPVDIVCAPEFSADAPTTVVAADAIPDDQMGLDIGPESIELFRSKLADAKSVVWNGPMGVFELAPFATGTLEVAKAIGGIDGTSVVGGGDSAAAVRKLGLEETFTHISTGGGASLELLEGKVLPGLAALEG